MLSEHSLLSKTADFIDISYTPALSQLQVVNQMQLVNRSCDNWKSNIRFSLEPEGVTNTDQAV